MAEQSEEQKFRDLAQAHHDAAGRLLTTGAESDAVYACLELRMALECLTYDLMKLYGDDVSDDILSKWQAGLILNALVQTDPGIESTLELQIAGEDGTFSQPLAVLRDERMEVKWAQKAYHQLGNFLHERSFADTERGVKTDNDVIRKRAITIHKEIGRILASSGGNLRLKIRFGMHCECGSQAQMDLSPSQLKSIARCAECGAIYEVIRQDPSRNKILSRRIQNG
ncbi:hypothetical protein ACLBXM_08210 [Xanthobacteraceae bacterium A53D]